MSVYQYRYWEQLKEFKTHVLYLHNYAVHSEMWDKRINIFLAITSSSSIAAWAIWQKYQMIWAIIIAISQIITAVKPFLPFKVRLKAVSDLNSRMQKISLDCEKGWYSVAEGELTDKEIHELCIKLREESRQAENQCLKGIVLPKKKKLLQNAEKDTDLYLTQKYHQGT